MTADMKDECVLGGLLDDESRSEGYPCFEAGSDMLVQVVVDLPEQRRNKSPQRQAPGFSSTPPTKPTPSPQPADPTESAQDQEQGPVLQRPFSSRPDGGVGWVEPDVVLSTFAATADSSPGMVETDALKAQGVL